MGREKKEELCAYDENKRNEAIGHGKKATFAHYLSQSLKKSLLKRVIENHLKNHKEKVSLDKPVGPDDDATLGTLIEDVKSKPSHNVAANMENLQRIRELLQDPEQFTPREKAVMELHFGLANQEAIEDCNRIGEMMNMPSSSVQRHLKTAIDKMRRALQEEEEPEGKQDFPPQSEQPARSYVVQLQEKHSPPILNAPIPSKIKNLKAEIRRFFNTADGQKIPLEAIYNETGLREQTLTMFMNPASSVHPRLTIFPQVKRCLMDYLRKTGQTQQALDEFSRCMENLAEELQAHNRNVGPTANTYSNRPCSGSALKNPGSLVRLPS